MISINKPKPYQFNVSAYASAWPFPVYTETTTTFEDKPVKLKDNPNFDKFDYKDQKDWANATQVKTIVSPDGNYASNGYVVAYKRAMPHAADCKMIQVAISFCSVDDDFKKKVGKYHAYLKLRYGEFIQLPLAFYSDVEIEEILTDMFSYVQ